MADTKTKLTSGQWFMARLEVSSRDKDALLKLAAVTINNSHTKRSYFERELPTNQTALNMRATYAAFNAATKKDLSTDQRLILVKQRYQKAGYGDFDKDFAKAYPKEFGKDKTKAKELNSALVARHQASRY